MYIHTLKIYTPQFSGLNTGWYFYSHAFVNGFYFRYRCYCCRCSFSRHIKCCSSEFRMCFIRSSVFCLPQLSLALKFFGFIVRYFVLNGCLQMFVLIGLWFRIFVHRMMWPRLFDLFV